MIELGGNIVLSGFKELDPAQLIVVKKIVGNYVKKIDELHGVKKLSLTLKPIHSKQVELHGTLDVEGDSKQAEVSDYNLFFALNTLLNKLSPK